MSRTRLAAIALMGILGSACVTEQTIDRSRSQTPANLSDAARINAQLGSDYARQGLYEVAEEKLRRSIEQDSRYAPAHTALAFVLTQRGNDAEAEREYRRALELDPEDAGTHNNLGVLLCNLGKTAEADRQFQQAIANRAYSTPEAALTNAGVCATKAGDRKRAEENFREALRRNPQFVDALGQIALLSHAKGDWLGSRAFIQRHEKLSVLSPELLLVAASAERELGDVSAARVYELRLLRDYPDSDQAVQWLRSRSSR